MNRIKVLPKYLITIFLPLLCSTSLLAQEGNYSKPLRPQSADRNHNVLWHEVKVIGFFSLAGPPSAPSKRIDAGGSCIIDLAQDYNVSGTLNGMFNIDYRIKVNGPCGSPLGTFDEDWIAHGTFSGTLNEERTTSSFTYVARVKAGGDVTGKIVFGQNLSGEVVVSGNFADLKLSYEGKLSTNKDTHYPIDHIAVILDQETLNAMAESPFLRNEFANSINRQPVREGGFEALYLYGMNTQYLEFVSKVRQTSIKTKPGDGMIAFNAEEEASVDRIIERMNEVHPESNPTKSLKTRLKGDEQLPFAHVATFEYESGHQGIGAWVLELDHEFKNRMSDNRIKVGDISRTRYGPSVRHLPDRYFQDVTSVTVVAPDNRRKNLVDLFTELGYKIIQKGDTTICTGMENEINLVPRTDQFFSILRIEVSLMRPKEGQKVYHFGQNVTLVFGDNLSAVFEFSNVSNQIEY